MFVNSKKISIKTSFFAWYVFLTLVILFSAFSPGTILWLYFWGKKLLSSPFETFVIHPKPKTQTQFSYTDHFIKKEMTSAENFFPCIIGNPMNRFGKKTHCSKKIFSLKKPKLIDCTVQLYCMYICICSLFKNKYSISEWNGVQIHSTGFVESCLTFLDELFAYKCYCRLEIKSDLCIRVYPQQVGTALSGQCSVSSAFKAQPNICRLCAVILRICFWYCMHISPGNLYL